MNLGPLEIASRAKSFRDRWVGHPRLNELGLHPARIAVTDALLAMRRLGLAPRGGPPALDGLRRDGIAVIPDALPADVFAAVRAEARAAIAEAARALPWPVNDERGFGRKRPFDGGFDRFDGDTLNRYLALDALPAASAAVRLPAIARLCAISSGFRHRPARFYLYQTVHGDERANPDPQRLAHRDTFHSTVKLWLFLDEVTEAHGPFMYAPGSHRMTSARYRWEHARAIAASRPDAKDRGGAFRVDAHELAALGLPPLRTYAAAANTLVIADVRGFHRRGDAAPGVERLSLYANLRLWPFSPVAY